MKRLLTVLALMSVVGSVSANDLRATIVDSIAVADTVGASTRIDTAVTPAMDIRGVRYLQFFSKLVPYGNATDTNWASDTFFVDVLSSADRITWKVHQVDTFLTSDSSWSPLNLDADATVFGNWIKGRVIHWDSLEATGPGLLANTYSKELQLWVIPKGGK